MQQKQIKKTAKKHPVLFSIIILLVIALKKKRGKTQIINLRDQRWTITTNLKEIKRILRELLPLEFPIQASQEIF